jgi:hypothetical protein
VGPESFVSVDKGRDETSPNDSGRHGVASKVLEVLLRFVDDQESAQRHALQEENLASVQRMLTVSCKILTTRHYAGRNAKLCSESVRILGHVPKGHFVQRVVAFLGGFKMGHVNSIMNPR